MKSETVTWPDAQPKGILFFLSLTCHHPIKSNLLQKKKFSITIIISCLCPKTESDAGWVWSHILHEEIADEGNVSKAISFVSQWSESALQSSVNELPPANIGDITCLTWWETSRPQPSFLLSSLRPRRRENLFWHRSIIWSVRRNLGENDKKKKKKKRHVLPTYTPTTLIFKSYTTKMMTEIRKT